MSAGFFMGDGRVPMGAPNGSGGLFHVLLVDLLPFAELGLVSLACQNSQMELASSDAMA